MNKKLLCISTNWPEANATAAGVRMHELLAIFISQEFEITFAATSKHLEGLHSLKEKGITTQQIVVNAPSFDLLLEETAPDVVLFDRFISEEQFGWRVRDILPNALTILDTEDLHCLRALRQEQTLSYIKKHKNTPYSLFDQTTDLDELNSRGLTKRELASMFRCDLNLVVSSFEMTVLVDHFKIPSHLCLLLPITYPKQHLLAHRANLDYHKRSGYFFIGNGLHKPNIDAIKCLYFSIWPLIKKQHKLADIYIYGAYLPQQIQELHKPNIGFHIIGEVKDVKTPFTKHRVNLVPLRFGAGIKGKILEGFVYGCPHITTSIGKEGMDYTGNWPGKVAHKSVEFAQMAVTLYQDKVQWQTLKSEGYELIDQSFERSVYEIKFLECLTQISNSLAEHRGKNFIGMLLQEQQFQASKYMSLWITEKNKNT